MLIGLSVEGVLKLALLESLTTLRVKTAVAHPEVSLFITVTVKFAVPPMVTAREEGAICKVGVFAVQVAETLRVVVTPALPFACPVAEAVTVVVSVPVV
jgi:hypothetical protein